MKLGHVQEILATRATESNMDLSQSYPRIIYALSCSFALGVGHTRIFEMGSMYGISVPHNSY